MPDAAGGRARSPRAREQLALPTETAVPSLEQLSTTLADHVRGETPRYNEPTAEFFLPVHGFVRLTADEVAIVDHPAFQRLGLVQQLGQANLVYRGATHKRFEHTLGTLHVAQKMLDAIATNHRTVMRPANPDPTDAPLADPPTDRERVFIRLAALLHDIGHLPAGHTLEDELRLLGRHDETERLRLVVDRSSWPPSGVGPLRQLIDRRYRQWIPAEGSATDLLMQLIAKNPSEAPPWVGGLVRIGLCRDIVGNTICADLLDYLHRDWYHIGKPKYFDERLLQYMEIRHGRDADHFVISLGRRPKIRTDAVSAILGLLESRYELAESVLFHRTKCAAAAMLERGIRELEAAIPEADRSQWLRDLEQDLLDHSDESALNHLLQEAGARSCAPALRPLSALKSRTLYSSISTTFRDELPGDISRKLFRTYTEEDEAPKRRNEAVQLIEEDIGLPPGSLVMYCPDKSMNAKIARVRIYINGTIAQFDEWEESNDHMLGGGHLEAQLHRFDRLWRIHLFVAREVWAAMQPERQELLRQAIETLILWRTPGESSIDARVHSLAVLAAKVEGTPYFEREPQDVLIGARGSETVLRYPNGAPTLRSFFR